MLAHVFDHVTAHYLAEMCGHVLKGTMRCQCVDLAITLAYGGCMVGKHNVCSMI